MGNYEYLLSFWLTPRLTLTVSTYTEVNILISLYAWCNYNIRFKSGLMLVKVTLFISQIGIVASPVTSIQPLSDSDCRVISENISEMKRGTAGYPSIYVI